MSASSTTGLHLLPSAMRLPQESATSWVWGLTVQKVKVPQPRMGFYWNMPDNAACVFSLNDKVREPRRYERGTVPSRPRESWSYDSIRASAAALRKKYPADVRGITRPRTWEDLYQWFDSHDLWRYGAWNLWNVLHLLRDEVEMRLGNVPLTPAVFREIDAWAYEWCTHAQNRLKLGAWDQTGDVLDVLSPADHNDIRDCNDAARSVLRGAFHYWYDQFSLNGPDGSSHDPVAVAHPSLPARAQDGMCLPSFRFPSKRFRLESQPLTELRQRSVAAEPLPRRQVAGPRPASL